MKESPPLYHRFKFIPRWTIAYLEVNYGYNECCELYGVWQEKEKAGVKKMGIVRSTFVINKEGVLTHVEYGVTAEGHAKNILDFVKGN